MDAYTQYLESIIDLREQEIKIYKDYIENRLGIRIQQAVDNMTPAPDYSEYRQIIIPEARYTIYKSGPMGFELKCEGDN
jgi:hypothetical protein